MSRFDDFLTDPAFAAAVDGVKSCLAVSDHFANPDPHEYARFIAMGALVAFTNSGGLAEPHVTRLARFAPDLGVGTDLFL